MQALELNSVDTPPRSRDSPARETPEANYRSIANHSPIFSDGTPSIRAVLPHLLATNSAWTTELELELLEFSESCEDYAYECERDAIHKHRANSAFRIISMFCSGSVAIVPHIQHVSAGLVSTLVSVVGATSLIANAVQSFCSFEKSANVERSASLQLREMSREIRLEITRPINMRWADPFAKMQTYEEKFNEVIRSISPKVVANDIKDKIKAARRQRIRVTRK